MENIVSKNKINLNKSNKKVNLVKNKLFIYLLEINKSLIFPPKEMVLVLV